MAGRGAFLAPALVPMSTCFVNLPRGFVQAFLGGPDMVGAGATILELSWETIEGYVQRVCVGWIGGLVKENALRSDVIEISSEFARCCGIVRNTLTILPLLLNSCGGTDARSLQRVLCQLGILQQEFLEKAPQSFLGVHVVESLPIARQVNVEPCTPDDWELIQLHAGLLESELLRQMCVVNDKQVNPIWVHQNVLIRIRVSLPVGMYAVFASEFAHCAFGYHHLRDHFAHIALHIFLIFANSEHARLSPNTEVIVAPKERTQPSADSALGRDYYYEASTPLVVQATSHAAKNDTLDEVWIHPETLALLDGAVLPEVPLSGQEPPVAAIWSLDNKTKNNNNNSSSVTSQTQSESDSLPAQKKSTKCSVARLKCSELVARGRVLLSRSTSTLLDVSAHSSVQLRVLKLPEIAPLRIVLKVHQGNGAATGDSFSVQQLQEAFLLWIQQLLDGLVAHSGSIIRFDVGASGQEESVVASVEVDYDAEDTISAKELEDIPFGAVEKYTLLGGRHGFMFSPDQIAVRTASDADLQALKVFSTESSEALNVSSDTAALQLARSAAAYDKVKKAIRSVLFRDASMTRVLLGANTPGSPLVYGDRGSGKTTILRSLARELEEHKNAMAYSIFVECRNLRGAKMETVKAKLTEIFDDAASHAPSVVILDNLDALVPEEDESAGPANEQSRRIAEFLVTLMQQNRDRMWKSTLELNRAFKRENEKIKLLVNGAGGSSSKHARAELLATIANSMVAKSVAVIATSRNDSSVHKSLRSCGLFDRPVQVTTPDAERREIVVREMLHMKTQTSAGKKTSRDVLEIDPSIDYGLLSSITEGYSLRDLSSATDRALHKTFTRYALQGAFGGFNVKKVLQSDFVDGVKDFQPTALIGVDLFKSSVKWSDVGGLSFVRTVLKDTLELPTRYGKLYDNTPIKLPAGMLLYGPPGCGKTLLASAVANECGLNFISVKGPEVLNKYIGASEQAIRDLFARAASAAPSVLFLDEFDSIAPRRGADNTGVTDRLVNQLLTFLDGVEGRKGVYVLAATSRPDMIDPALLRPGRLDKSLYCGFPSEEERLDILRAVGKDMELDAETFEYLPEIAAAAKSVHFSGADLQAIMYSAQLELVHEKLKPGGEHSNVILKRHVQVAFENAKPSTSEAARLQFETMYANFSRARTTDFAVATADTTASPDKMKSPITHQRTALA